jgi:hypothetical protein
MLLHILPQAHPTNWPVFKPDSDLPTATCHGQFASAPSSPVIFFSLFFFHEGEVGLSVSRVAVCHISAFESFDDGNWCEHHASTVCRVTVISYTSRDNMVDARYGAGRFWGHWFWYYEVRFGNRT